MLCLIYAWIGRKHDETKVDLRRYLEASAILISEGVGASLEDEGLPLQHVVLPRDNLHERLAATEVQEGTPA